ncbi:M23 family metallopeptidase [Bacillus sp. FJAT-49731]|uniref:M23 family metallopeptidase n=2 Tax=Lederbergia citrea TaxID=2833581 RepID=A0A942UMH9_9BACI|nr:M23 family metallopeptidase [Lederbergia citrea]MBS4204737.1 M23 family metallopeptidase [Lederbergia citrea]MBS4223415.1 M23 family metallopeptidase [Lederbergia citrea]
MREEEKNQSSQWKNFFKKRWVFPAVYLVSAALLISMIVWYQTSSKDIAKSPNVSENGKNITGKTNDEPVVEVNQSFENIAWPVTKEDEVNIVTQFFDANAPLDKQEEALIVDGSKYRQNTGIDIAAKNGEEFDVLAAVSGKVVTARQDPLLGNVIEIEHDKGIVTVYQSVKDMKVKVGDLVEKGEILAKSSTSQLNLAAANHVHFEIRKDNVALNPLTYFGQPLTALSEAEKEMAPASEQLDAGDETDKATNVEESEDANKKQSTEEVEDTHSPETDTETDLEQ